MYVISVDVGIKKLSLCVSRILESAKIEIKYWKVCSIFSDPSNQTCTIEGCDKKPNWKIQDQVYCAKHSKTDKNTTKRKKHSSPKVKNTKLDTIVRRMQITLQTMITEINHEDISISKVYIELQMARNAKMKLVSHVIFSELCRVYSHVPVQFVRANVKFAEKCPKGKKNYTSRKKLGVEKCKEIIERHVQDSERWMEFLKKYNYSYDLCDSFLLNIDLKPFQ